jgi:hypothetical protein
MLIPRRRRAAAIPAAIVVGAAMFVPGLVGVATSSPTVAPANPPVLSSPPLFAAAGQGREVAAEVPAEPGGVRLVVTNAATGATASYPMQRQTETRWTGTIPGGEAGSDLEYSVSADYADASVASDEAHLIVLEELVPVDATAVANAGRTLMTLKLGDTGELGSRGGDESATEIPPSFAVDEQAQEVLFLDAVNNRIVAFDMKGHPTRTIPLETDSRSASDVLFDPGSRTARVLDQARDTLLEVTDKSQRRVAGLGLRGSADGARLSYDPRDDAAYVRDVAQGRFLPVTRGGRRASSSHRASGSRAGAPTPLGNLAIEVGDHSVTFGLTGSTSRGFRLDLADEVLDAGEVLVDGDGTVWGLVGLYQSGSDSAYTVLVRLDPSSGATETTRVPSSVPGDVTRRLAAVRHGVVLLEGEGDTLRLVAFGAMPRGSR